MSTMTSTPSPVLSAPGRAERRWRRPPLADRVMVWADAARTGMWPVPLMMLMLAFGAWWCARWADARLPQGAIAAGHWLHGGTGADAQNLLATLVTAIITLASIVFSITIVTLTLAASQFGSRLVRTYMADQRTKLSLGLFVMTVVYCLLALRSVQHDMAAAQVPHVTVTLALVFGMACVVVLVLFLHHIARSIVADEVIRRVAAELEQSIAALADGAHACTPPPAALGLAGSGVMLRSSKEGYVQLVDHARLLTAAQQHRARIVLTFPCGAFLCRDGWLAQVHPAGALDDELSAAIHEAILIGTTRTPAQDLQYSMRHLVDVALRALSPGINDANTAVVVIDRLRGALSTLLGKRLPATWLADASGMPVVVVPGPSYAELIDHALDQIRRAAGPHPEVVMRLLLAIDQLAEHVRLPEQWSALERQARLAAAEGLRQTGTAADRVTLSAGLTATLAKLERVRRLGPQDRERSSFPLAASGTQCGPNP